MSKNSLFFQLKNSLFFAVVFLGPIFMAPLLCFLHYFFINYVFQKNKTLFFANLVQNGFFQHQNKGHKIGTFFRAKKSPLFQCRKITTFLEQKKNYFFQTLFWVFFCNFKNCTFFSPKTVKTKKTTLSEVALCLLKHPFFPTDPDINFHVFFKNVFFSQQGFSTKQRGLVEKTALFRRLPTKSTFLEPKNSSQCGGKFLFLEQGPLCQQRKCTFFILFLTLLPRPLNGNL